MNGSSYVISASIQTEVAIVWEYFGGGTNDGLTAFTGNAHAEIVGPST